MDFYENLVSLLPGHKGCFYLLQVDIRQDTGAAGRLACLDFVALNFADEEIHLVEVNKQGQGKKAAEKLDPAGCPPIEDVKNNTLHGRFYNYRMVWWTMPDKPLPLCSPQAEGQQVSIGKRQQLQVTSSPARSSGPPP